jgi:hypothetical protein
MQRIVDQRSRSIDEAQGPEESRRKALERRQMAIQFDIDQGELAQEPDNPWTHRIELLTEALANVEAELVSIRKVEPQPFHPLPATPVEDLEVSREEPYRVSFWIDGERFVWQERLDWIERGGIMAQPELVKERGDAHALVPADTPDHLRGLLGNHLAGSVTTLAVSLRDARLNEQALPQSVTLADLARPCPVCGVWTDWNGHCNACANRKVQEQALFGERQHLMKERSAEAEERHRLAERLPLARKRMADLQRELAGLDR